MPRIALISDIHGNAVALRAALEEIERLAVDRVVCLGDVAATGPQPHEATALLRRRAIPSITGNADAEILEPSNPETAEGSMQKYLAISAWGNMQLDEDDRSYLTKTPATREFDLDGAMTLLCVHGSPRSYDEAMRSDTDTGELDAMLDGHSAGVVASGHTHIQMFRRHRGTLLVNPGSIGLPPNPVPPAEDVRYVAWAEFGILDASNARLAWSFHRVPYALGSLLDVARSSGMPHAEWWSSLWREAG